MKTIFAFLVFSIIISLSFCDNKKNQNQKTTDNEESVEEFLQKEMNAKIDKYLLIHNLDKAKTIDKKTFIDLYKNVTSSEKAIEFVESESKIFNEVGEEFVKDMPNEIPVENLKKIINFDEIVNFYIKKTTNDEKKSGEYREKKVIPGSMGDTEHKNDL